VYTLLGIDISKDSLALCAPVEDIKPRQWPVLPLDLKHPDWWQPFNQLIAPGCIVVAEPTGWHYLQPVATALKTWTPSAQLWLITHQAAAQIRQAHIAAQKTDALDARALALVAQLIAAGQPPRHVRQYNHDLEEQVTVLRLYVNTRTRLVRQATRTLNQLDAFGHALWPELNYRKTTWHSLIDEGVITPAQIKAFAASLRPTEELSRQRIHFIKTLAAALPDIEVPAAAVLSIQRLHTQLRQITREQNEVEGIIHVLIHAYPFAAITRRWETVPKVSAEAIAALHVATHGQADQITPDEFKAAVGAFPQLEHSGKMQKSKATKKGYRPAINAVYMWAARLVSPNAPDNPIRRYHQKKGDFPATKAKLARLLSGVARNPAGYHFDPGPDPEGEPHER
jgi:hypothetical protein